MRGPHRALVVVRSSSQLTLVAPGNTRSRSPKSAGTSFKRPTAGPGILHTVSTTAANVTDIDELSKLLSGQEKEVFVDQAYWSEAHRQGAKSVGVRYRVNRRSNGHVPLTVHQKRINRVRSRARARCEHALSGDQTSVGLHEGALSRVGQEHCEVVHGLCTGEPVPVATTVVAGSAAVPVMIAERGETPPPSSKAGPTGPRRPFPMSLTTSLICNWARTATCAEFP